MNSPRLTFLFWTACCCSPVLWTGEGMAAVTIVKETGTAGINTRPKACMVNGRPAVAWVDLTTRAVKYTRAADGNGDVWEAPVTLATLARQDTFDTIALGVLNGKPAVCYCNDQPSTVWLRRATDAAGAAWDPPQAIHTQPAMLRAVALVEGGGVAMAFVGEVTNQNVYCLRALDANGTAWASPVLAAKAVVDAPLGISAEVVEGNPALAFFGNSRLRYVRAADTVGSTWGTAPELAVNNAWSACSLWPVNGQPAILSYETQDNDIRYRRAPAAGGSWTTVVLEPALVSPAYSANPVLNVINGRPAACFGTYRTGNGQPAADELKYAESNDSDGGTWRAPVVINGGIRFNMVSLLEVNGLPAIIYNNTAKRGLEYVRAVSSSGAEGTKWPPVPQLELMPAAQVVASGGSVDLGTLAAAGQSTVRMFQWRNLWSGAAPLTVTDATFEGPNAAEFSFTAPVPASVAASGMGSFSVRWAPVGQGGHTATLHLRNNAQGTLHDYAVVLSGTTPRSGYGLWRFAYFQTDAVTGDTAADADPDHDGLVNLVEYAFGLSPLSRSESALPAFTRAGNVFTASFTALGGREDVIYAAEWSPDMTADSWTSVPDTGSPPQHTFSVPAAGGRAFVRWVVRLQ